MIAYWERDCEWMGEGLQLAICPSFTGPTSLAALDVSGLSNHGTLTNMDSNTAWQTSGGKLALGPFGNPRYVDIPDRPHLNPTAQIGFSVWYNSEVTSSSFAYCLLGKSTTVNAQPYPAFDIRAAGGNILECAIAIGATSRLISLGSLVANEWTNVAFTYNGTVLSGYRNGNLVASLAVTGAIGTTTNSLFLGENPGFRGRYFSGFIDDCRMYNRALTAPEIRQSYERDRGGGMLHQPPRRRSYYAQLAAAFSILAQSGSYALTGQPIPLLYGRALSADTGSVLLSGQTTPLLTSRLLNADQGYYAYTGTDAATLLGRLLDAGAAAYTLDGNAAGFLASRRISADTVAYLASGLDAGFLRTRVLEAGTGQYVLVASPVNITTGTGGAAPYYYLFLLGGSR
jgi:hypothetical protein